MSVAMKNPFALLDDEDTWRPAPPAAPKAPTHQKSRGGTAARGGRYHVRGGKPQAGPRESASPRHDEADLELINSASTSNGPPLNAASSLAAPEAGEDESDLALRQTIQGVYRLWKGEQKRKALDGTPELFLSLMRSAIQA